MRRLWILFGALSLLLLLLIVSVSVGAVAIAPHDIWPALVNPDSASYFIVHELRLPRALVGVLAGFGLAVGGAILQSLIRNPLASPDVIGLTKGAGFLAAGVIFLFPKAPLYALPLAAFAGALAAFLLLLMLSRRFTLSPAAVALVGVAIGAIFQAGTQYWIVTNPTNINMALLWLSGSLWSRGWPQVAYLLPAMAVLLPLAWGRYKTLNVLQLGDESGLSLGLRLSRTRFWLFLLAVGIAGLSVSAVGAIGFVGLLAPHLARILVGGRHQWQIPLSALIGANLMLLGDCVGRMLIIPREVPVGIMTAILGAPYFVYLLRRERLRRVRGNG